MRNSEIDNNNSISHAVIEEYRRLKIDTKESETSPEIIIEIKKLEPASECCIYKVPKDLRSLNEKAYTPKFISIGPFHYGNEELAEMEKQKVRYKMHFGERLKDEGQWDDFVTFIKENEQQIRNCYAESIELESLEFLTMILYDAFFIIELLLKFHEGGYRDFLLQRPLLRESIRLDLQLLENQLPYLVLHELYRIAGFATSSEYPDFFSLSSSFLLGIEDNKNSSTQVKHFTDLRRNHFLQNNRGAFSPGPPEDICSAVKLQEAGVKFKVTNHQENQLLDIRLEKRNRSMIPFLKVVELQIPRLEILGETEFLLRNTMAFEQCHYPMRHHVCSYVEFLDFLIKSEKDVDLLVENGIIVHRMRDNAEVTQMFNNLCKNIVFAGSCYYDILHELNERWRNNRNATRAILIIIIRLGAAVSLLTLVQTVVSVQQAYFK